MKRISEGELVDIPAEEARELELERVEQERFNNRERLQFSYREARAKEYAEQLGLSRLGASEVEKKFNAIGDVLDAIIKMLDGNPVEFEAMLVQIGEIKRAHPDPEAEVK